MQLIIIFNLYLVLHAYATRFDVMESGNFLGTKQGLGWTHTHTYYVLALNPHQSTYSATMSHQTMPKKAGLYVDSGWECLVIIVIKAMQHWKAHCSIDVHYAALFSHCRRQVCVGWLHVVRLRSTITKASWLMCARTIWILKDAT